MNQLRRIAVAPLLALLVAGCTESPVETAVPIGEVQHSRASAATLLDAVAALNQQTGEFSTFLAAAAAADIEAELAARGQTTLFAPTDTAFGRLLLDADNVVDVVGAELLREILLYPTRPGRRPGVSVLRADRIKLANGDMIPITRTGSDVRLGDSRIVITDVEARNGVVHGIDRLLVPEGVIVPPVQVEPPFWGTIFIDPNIMTGDDPTTFTGLTPAGHGGRWMFDRRVNAWTWVEAHLFNATFSDGLTAEIQVNPEFDAESALAAAEKYTREIGRLPTELRKDMETVWIHRGVQAFGGGNNNILIHTGQADLYEQDGILHETLLHEAVHTSLDGQHGASEGWRAAQTADGNFISGYARDYPDGEDLAESFVPWFAVRYAADRIPESLYDQIVRTIPHRLAYLDAQDLNLYPVE